MKKVSAANFLAAMDWDIDTAKPSMNKLVELNMEDVARVLWS